MYLGLEISLTLFMKTYSIQILILIQNYEVDKLKLLMNLRREAISKREDLTETQVAQWCYRVMHLLPFIRQGNNLWLSTDTGCRERFNLSAAKFYFGLLSSYSQN